MTDQELLQKIADDEGYSSVDDLLCAAVMGDQCYGICKECNCTMECEPDATRNWCPECDKNTIVSCLILAEVI